MDKELNLRFNGSNAPTLIRFDGVFLLSSILYTIAAAAQSLARCRQMTFPDSLQTRFFVPLRAIQPSHLDHRHGRDIGGVHV